MGLYGYRRNRRSLNFSSLPDFCVPGYSPVSVDRYDPDTLVRGLRKRVCRDLPPITAEELVEYKRFVLNWCKANLKPVEIMSFEDWLKSTAYNQKRKDELAREWEKMRGQAPTKRQCRRIDSFVKLEAYEELKEARWINSRSDAFKVYCGPAFKSIEQEVYKNPWFIKHTPVPQRPKLIAALRKAGYRYYENDYKAYESHFTKTVMEACECVMIRYMLQRYSVLSDRICEVLTGENKLHTRVGVSVLVEARRMSGEICTSLDNGFCNLMNVLYIVHKKGGVAEGFVEGDDGLFATTVELTAKDFFDLGFTVEINELNDPTDGHFCGMTVTDEGEVIKSHVKVFETFSWSQKYHQCGHKLQMRLLRAKALSLAYECPNCPILGALAQAALEHTRGYTQKFIPDGYHRMPKDELGVPEFRPSVAAREKYERLFGIPISTQLLAEQAIREKNMVKLSLLLPAPADVQWYTERYVVEC